MRDIKIAFKEILYNISIEWELKYKEQENKTHELKVKNKMLKEEVSTLKVKTQTRSS